MVKKGFSLLELVVAIVVIAIAVVSLPMMMMQANKSDEDAINQDVFFHCMVIMNDIGSRYWDKSMAIQAANGNGSLIVDVNGTKDLTLNRISTINNYRLGHFARNIGDARKFYDYNLTGNGSVYASGIVSKSPKALDASDLNISGIEEYDGLSLDMRANADISAKFDVQIRYVDDNCSAPSGGRITCNWNLTSGGYIDANQSTNLKRAVVTAKKNYGSQPVTVNYSAFFSNIGRVDTRSK